MPTITQPHAEDRDRPLLVRMDATNSGEVCAIKTQATVGRHPDNTLCIDDEGISRFHLKVTVEGLKCWVEDLGSSNGSYLNGRRISGAELANGDMLQLGPRVCFRFSVASQHEESVLRQLYESSVRDPLTGAHNRQHFADRLRSEFAYAVRHQSPLSFVMLDIDFFKKVNDTYGHLGGDTALTSVATTLMQQLRTEDLFARYGGEEFAMLLRGTDLRGATQLAERLRRSIAAAPVAFRDQQIQITVSMGCASMSCVREEPSPDALIAAADRRLYAAKELGRNRVIATD